MTGPQQATTLADLNDRLARGEVLSLDQLYALADQLEAGGIDDLPPLPKTAVVDQNICNSNC
ncbi:MAG TPA: hypothetical protein VD866_25445 [Urbifossiella sp.]|nr:hypothetical protein [Urbifossiella sp.]